MTKFDVIVADPSYKFSDKLTMSSIKRGAESQYPVLSNEALMNLDVESIAADDAILVLWVPSSLLDLGMKIMESWGFKQTQTFIWVKIKKEPIKDFVSNLLTVIKKSPKKDLRQDIYDLFDLNNILGFFMGRLFRQTHEIALVGKKGKVYDKLENKSQRSVIFAPNFKHSAKPEELQDKLDIMFSGNKLEMFARRLRPGWTCVGNELPVSEDIRDSIKRLASL